MLLKTVPSCSLLNPHVETLSPLPQPSSFSFSPLNSSAALASSSLRFSPAKRDTNFVLCASKGGANSKPLIGVVFEPFEEVKKELDLVPTVPQLSLARQKYADDCEAAINEQIKWVFSIFFKIVSFLFSLKVCDFVVIFLYWVFYFNSFFVVKMTVWNTMFRMSTMPCLPTLIGTTLR